jgi:hypothetical protein
LKTAAKMTETVELQDWAWEVAADIYRLNLFGQLTGRITFAQSCVSDDELAEAIAQSFTQVSEARYREMIELATDAAMEAYERVVSAALRESRGQRPN